MGRLGGIPLLQCADDTTFFIRGSTVAAHHIATMMDIFSDFSGLQLNKSKSSVIGIGLAAVELARVSAVLATPVASFPILYLGLPLTEGRLRAHDWQPVMEKIETRLGGWQARLLSRGGRLVLLQSVLAAIPIYFMAIFRLPEGMRRQIETIMRRFFWQGARLSKSRGVALVAWRTVCRPKVLGGLGIRHLKHTSMALLAKWVNRIMQQAEDLAVVVLRSSYDAAIDLETWSTPCRGDSAFMQGLRPVFTSMQPLFRPRVGDGAIFSFWETDWSGHGRFRATHLRLYALALNPGASVQTVWDASWFPSLPSTISDQRYVDLLDLYTSLIPIQLSERTPDVWEWRSGLFSARAVYHHFQALESTSDSCTLLKCCRLHRKCRIPLKIKLFGWLLLRQRLMTRSLRQRFCPDAPTECPLCAGAAEDCSHLFFKCQFAQMAWRVTHGSDLRTSTAASFWRSLSVGPFRRASE